MNRVISGGWKAQDLLRREDVVEILTSNLIVASHLLPDNTAGILYCVDGVAICADAIMDLMEQRALFKKNKEEKQNG